MSKAMTPFRKTKIVCTIGPTSCSREDLFGLADQGMHGGSHTSAQWQHPLKLDADDRATSQLRVA